MTRSTISELTREQQAALTVFVKNQSNMKSIIEKTQYLGKKHPIPHTNFIAASNVPFQISKLPRDINWTWNQSNAKIVVKLDETTTVIFKKISPRARKIEGTVPSYKMWLYQIETVDTEYSFLWCEKGMELPKKDEGVFTEIGTIYPSQISTESLSFLQPFVEFSVANELGWTQIQTLC